MTGQPEKLIICQRRNIRRNILLVFTPGMWHRGKWDSLKILYKKGTVPNAFYRYCQFIWFIEFNSSRLWKL